MPCNPNELRHVPLFSLLDDEELAVLAQQVEVRDFTANERIYKAGEPSPTGYIMFEGRVTVTLIDKDEQEVVIAEPRHGEFFGFASMLENVAHQTTALAVEATTCVEVDRRDIETLIQKKPMAGLDMLTVLAQEIHSAQMLVKVRAGSNANEVIDESETFGERIADRVASFGGSWTFILLFMGTMTAYVTLSIVLVATRGKSWDPYPFILLNLFLSMLAAIQAPVIMMSQNRQDKKDRVRSELDFDVNRRAENEIQSLSRKLNQLADTVGDVHDMMRGPNLPRRDDEMQG